MAGLVCFVHLQAEDFSDVAGLDVSEIRFRVPWGIGKLAGIGQFRTFAINDWHDAGNFTEEILDAQLVVREAFLWDEMPVEAVGDFDLFFPAFLDNAGQERSTLRGQVEMEDRDPQGLLRGFNLLPATGLEFMRLIPVEGSFHEHFAQECEGMIGPRAQMRESHYPLGQTIHRHPFRMTNRPGYLGPQHTEPLIHGQQIGLNRDNHEIARPGNIQGQLSQDTWPHSSGHSQIDYRIMAMCFNLLRVDPHQDTAPTAKKYPPPVIR